MAATESVCRLRVSPSLPACPSPVPGSSLVCRAEQWQQLQLQAGAFSQPLAMEIKWKPAKVSRDDFTP